MRALRTRPGPLDADDRWEAFLQEVIPAAPLPDLWLYGEPYPALNGVVLDRDEHRALAALTRDFAAVFHKAVRALQRDGPALERLGFPWVALELLAREAPDEPLLLGRFDFVLDRGGDWQLLEYNADTPPGDGRRSPSSASSPATSAGAPPRRLPCGAAGPTWRPPCAGPSAGPSPGCRPAAGWGS
jgi:hypothetical protein